MRFLGGCVLKKVQRSFEAKSLNLPTLGLKSNRNSKVKCILPNFNNLHREKHRIDRQWLDKPENCAK